MVVVFLGYRLMGVSLPPIMLVHGVMTRRNGFNSQILIILLLTEKVELMVRDKLGGKLAKYGLFAFAFVILFIFLLSYFNR